jgi:hypothetical protein
MKKIKLQLLYLFFLVALIPIAGCQNNRETPVIERNKMVEILTDIHLTQAIVEQEPLPQGAKKEYYYCSIFERHGVTEELFDSAIGWYSANMDVFEKVYIDVIANMERKKTELEEVK